MNDGWIKLQRTIKDHWLWSDADKLKRWIDILFTVNWEDKKVVFGNKLIECKRGQSVKSMESWAEKWGVSEHAVRNFFKLLQNDEMIVVENLKFTSRLTVCNYETYQSDGRSMVGERSDVGRTSVGRRSAIKEREEIKEVNPPISPLPESLKKIDGFEIAWNEWLKYRRKRKFTCLPMCLDGQLKILMDQPDPIAVINQSITQGYQGLFPLKGYNNGNNRNGSRQLKARTQYNDGLVFDIDQS